eukprot:11162517-Lingulodinium_polyedra.AAC.1
MDEQPHPPQQCLELTQVGKARLDAAEREASLERELESARRGSASSSSSMAAAPKAAALSSPKGKGPKGKDKGKGKGKKTGKDQEKAKGKGKGPKGEDKGKGKGPKAKKGKGADEAPDVKEEAADTEAAAPDERSHKRKRNDRRLMMRVHKLSRLFDPAPDQA